MNRPSVNTSLVKGSIGAALLVVLGGAAVVHLQASVHWSSLQTQAVALEAEWRARTHTREPLFGERREGDAFDGYEAALAQAAKLSADDKALIATLPHEDDRKLAGIGDLRAAWRPAIDTMRAASHCTQACPTQLKAEGNEVHIVNMLSARWLVNMSVVEARCLRLQGKHREAVELTLDAAAFGADLVRTGPLVQQMVGAAMVAIAVHEAWTDEALRRLDPESLALLASGLARLDAQMHPTLDLIGEQYCTAAQVLKAPVGSSETTLGAPSLRYGFSTQWMMADAFLRMSGCYARLSKGDPQQPWPQRTAVIERELGELAASGNPICKIAAPNLASAERSLRTAVAMVRMLRMAIEVLQGKEPTELQDPLGPGVIAVDRQGPSVRLFSHAHYRGQLLVRNVTGG